MDDLSIIELFWNRNEVAIVQTDKKYGKLCMHLSENILNNYSDAEECVNDSYLTVWNRIPDERPLHFSAFLCRIVKNLSLKKLEYNTAQKRNPELLTSFDELQGCLSRDADCDGRVDVSILAEEISNFLSEQKAQNRNIFIRRYWYFDSVKEIAEDLGMKEERVSTLLFRMRNKMKKYLEKGGYEI